MKVIIYLFSLFLLFGCAGRNAKTSVQKKSIEAEISEKIKSKEQTDVTEQKEEKSEGSKTTKTVSSDWKYKAPTTFPCDNQNTFVKPFWLIVNGDSINVANMPAGSSLESSNTDTQTDEKYTRTISELNKKVSSLEIELDKKAKIQYIEKEKIKEVERQSLQWLLVGLAFLAGAFIKPIFKFIKNYFKLI